MILYTTVILSKIFRKLFTCRKVLTSSKSGILVLKLKKTKLDMFCQHVYVAKHFVCCVLHCSFPTHLISPLLSLCSFYFFLNFMPDSFVKLIKKECCESCLKHLANFILQHHIKMLKNTYQTVFLNQKTRGLKYRTSKSKKR